MANCHGWEGQVTGVERHTCCHVPPIAFWATDVQCSQRAPTDALMVGWEWPHVTVN